ncbi:serine/threonine-protein kinase Sgk2 [Akanthomyces lecanii RCEF 1005]|uniref:non-specific serine/threonine protein kinase n=1 Tax=Akanthomyces lecanii RCEF 1005 TaxID=1081108 RepID=A0A162N6T3_CORDF|nr:serine/threonine-protein kinase Sgk2 [Akanthomyces lecanii RCEF 1005]
MPFSEAEENAIKLNPLQDMSKTAEDLCTKLDDGDEWTRPAQRFLMRHFLENNASKEIFTSRRDADVGSKLFQIARFLTEDHFSSISALATTCDKFSKQKAKGLRIAMKKRVVKDITESDIWLAIVELIDRDEELQAPKRFGCSTPVRAGTARFADNEVREVVEGSIIDELRLSVFRNVPRFVDHHFDISKWNQEQKDMLDRVLKHHKDSHWTHFPKAKKTDEDAVYKFLKDIEEACFSNAPNKLNQSKTSRSLSDRKGQLDLFFHPARTGDEKHEFGKVVAVGEHKTTEIPDHFRSVFSQMSRYVRNIYAAQPTRACVHAFTIQGFTLELWVFDRSGAYSSGRLNIHEHPQALARALVGYATMNMGNLEIFKEDANIGKYITLNDVDDSSSRQIQIKEQIFCKSAITGRGTMCFSTPEGVLKLSWRTQGRRSEADFLLEAKSKGVQGVATIIAFQELASVEDHRGNLLFTKEFAREFRNKPTRQDNPWQGTSSASEGSGSKRSWSGSSAPSSSASSKRRASGGLQIIDLSTSGARETLSSILYARSDRFRTSYDERTTYEPRILTAILVQPAGRPIRYYKTPFELLRAMRDATLAHLNLFREGILHRDISINNIIITEPNEENHRFEGMLIDLDMAKARGEEDMTSQGHRTGTMEFMAYEVLLGRTHTYIHDLESFLYVLIWLCSQDGWHKPQARSIDEPRANFVNEWRVGSLEEIATEKRAALVDIEKFDELLNRFPVFLGPVKKVCRQIRYALQSAKRDPVMETVYWRSIEAYNYGIRCYSEGK